MTKTIDKFISEIKSGPLSQEEERRLFSIYQNRHDGWSEAKDTVIHSCLLYVVKCAYSYSTNNNKIEDLISEGSIGLVEAFEKFQLDNGARFLTFASFSIRGKMLRHISKSSFDSAFSVPPEVAKIACDIRNYIQEWKDKHKDSPSRSHLLNHFGIDDYALSYYYILIASKSFSIDNSELDEDLNTTSDIEDLWDINAALKMEKKESKSILNKIICNLPLKQKIVITKRFGLDNSERECLESIGKELAITKQRVSQIEIEALKTIRKEIKKFELNMQCLQ